MASVTGDTSQFRSMCKARQAILQQSIADVDNWLFNSKNQTFGPMQTLELNSTARCCYHISFTTLKQKPTPQWLAEIGHMSIVTQVNSQELPGNFLSSFHIVGEPILRVSVGTRSSNWYWEL